MNNLLFYFLNSVFASLIFIPISVASSAVRLQICVIIAGIEKYKSIIKKREKIMIN